MHHTGFSALLDAPRAGSGQSGPWNTWPCATNYDSLYGFRPQDAGFSSLASPARLSSDHSSTRQQNGPYHRYGWDPEVVGLMKEAALPLLRFPGGNFSSGYHWRDGVGPTENRPILPNPAWPEIECNDAGTDDWLRLCDLVGCEAMICVNGGNGTPEEAAQWVEYCNGRCGHAYGGSARRQRPSAAV
jgi:hypothetical protein